MPSRNPGRRPRALLLPAVLGLGLALGGCSSDDAASTSAGAGASRDLRRGAGDTTDAGSRFLDAGGPVGGLTVETPPVGAPPDRGRPVTQR